MNSLFVIIKPDNKTFVYSKYPMAVNVLLKRSVEQYTAVFRRDIADITSVVFKDDLINLTPVDGDKFIWLFRENWTFGLYFDLSGKLQQKTLMDELGYYYRYILYIADYLFLERGNNFDEMMKVRVFFQAQTRFLRADSDAILHRNRQTRGVCHSFHKSGHMVRPGHQTGSEIVFLNLVAGASAVQINLVVPVAFGNPAGLRQVFRLIPAQLQYHRFFRRIKGQQLVPLPPNYCRSCNHLCVKKSFLSNPTHNPAPVPVGLVYHRRQADRVPGVRSFAQRLVCHQPIMPEENDFVSQPPTTTAWKPEGRPA